MIAVAVGTGVGVNAILSRSLGEKNYKEVNGVAVNSLLLYLLSFLLFAVFGALGARFFMNMQTDIGAITQYGTTYLFIVCMFSFGVFGQVLFERLLQSTGKTIYSMITQGTGAIVNIILDPILIFGLFGFPRLEVAGAAIATVIGQIVAMLFGLYFNLRVNKEISISLKGFRPSLRIIKRIYSVGIPSIIMQSIASVMTFGLNRILLSFESTAAAVFGVYFKLQSFVFMPIFGLNNGMVPIIAYNYGAKKIDRLSKTLKLSIIYAVCIMLAGVALLQFFPNQLLLLFDASPSMLRIGVIALRTISLSYVFAGFCIVSSSMFQALGNGITSMVVSIVRQLVVLLPVAFLLSKTGNLDLVWLAFPVAECVAVAMCIYYLRRTYKTTLAK